jgi:uncharacterized iron-regulated protein
VGLVLALAGCASAGPRPSARDPGGRVVDARSGRVVAPDELDRRLAAARVVLVGEEHANPAFHAVQEEVLWRVAKLVSGRVAMGVEWLPRSTRPALEGFLGASPPASLDALRAAVRWDELWGHDFQAYRPLLGAARRLGVAIVPLNAEPGLARLVAKGGVERVPPERRAELPPLTSGSEAHRAWFAARMEAAEKQHPGHAVTGEALERYYLAQLVWDETMAAALREAAASQVVVAFAGLGHVERGLGIPARLGDLPCLVIVPVPSLAEAERRAREADFPEREADLFWVL